MGFQGGQLGWVESKLPTTPGPNTRIKAHKGRRLAASLHSTHTRHGRRASMNRRPMGERRLDNGEWVLRRRQHWAMRCRSMIHCPARPSPPGWKHLMGKTGLHCGVRRHCSAGQRFETVSFSSLSISPSPVQGTLISACRRTASRVPRSACYSTLMSSSSELFLGLFWKRKRSRPGALPADVGALWISFAFVADPMLCPLPACRPAALPLCRPAFEARLCPL